MALFPYDPLDVVVEMNLGGWQEVTSDVYHRDKIRITRGRQNEQGAPSPSSCQLTLDNRTGKYAPRNPLSPYYPLLGRNTALRVGVRVAKDAFGRTVSNGWGTADVGGAWTVVGTASRFATTGSAATMAFTTANDSLLAYQAGQVYGDVDVACTVTVPVSDVTGASLEPLDLVLGGLSTADYYQARLLITTSETLTLDITQIGGSTVVPAVTVTSFTYTGQALRVRFQQDSQTLRAKVWPAGTAEPYAWTCEGHVSTIYRRGPGWVGIRSGVPISNTNVPITYAFDDFEVRVPRFAGEIAAFPPQWDVSGRDVYTQIEAAGPRRRLSQGSSPLKSTYLRGNQTISPAHIAYWPVEDLDGSTQIASGIGGQPMSLVLGTTTFASDSSFPGSAPIAKTNQSRWVAPIPRNTATGQIQLMLLLSVPSSGEVDQATLAQIQTNGTAAFIDVFYQSAGGGGMKFAFYDAARTSFHISGTMPHTLDGRPVMISVELTQNGADVDYKFVTLAPGSTSGASNSGTAPGCTINSVTGLFINAYRQATSSAIGHVAVRSSITSIFTLAKQLKAYAGEEAGTRTLRLAGENSIGYTFTSGEVFTNQFINSAQVGVQGRKGLLELMDEAADATFGTVYESRSHPGLWQRQRSSLYNQPATLTLNYAAGQLVPPFQPIEDDQNLRNDITVTRAGGSSFEATQTSGRLAVTSPSDGTGVGRYDDAVTLNLYTDDQLQDAAGWRLNLGTVDEARYPQITVNVAKLATISQQLALDAMAVNLDDRILINNPKTLINPDPISQLARGYTEVLGGKEWAIFFNCAPASPYDVVVLDSASMGKIDSDTTTLAGDVTSTASKLLVVDTSACGWTSTPAEMPIPITVGGESMSVTAVTALGPSFVAAGVAATGNNTSLAPALPAGLAEGDAMVCLTAIRNSPDGGPQMPADWSLLAFTPGFCLWGKIAGAAESAPTVSFSGGVANATTIAQVAAFRGCSVNVVGAASQLNGSAQNIAYPARTISAQRSVVIIAGWKQDDWTSVATLAGATEIGEPSSTLGDDAGIVWDYIIQPFTAPANIAAGSFTVTGGASAISRGMVVELNGNAQLMTVTRSVNGVIKAQTAGTQVSLTRRATIAL